MRVTVPGLGVGFRGGDLGVRAQSLGFGCVVEGLGYSEVKSVGYGTC